jgi:transposase
MDIKLVGLDLAKRVFALQGEDGAGRVLWRRELRRAQVLRFFARLSPCEVAMEACGGAHYWGRELARLGHRPKLLNPRDVKRYVRTNKSDRIDADACCQAARSHRVREVPLKAPWQQDWQGLLRMREGLVRARTALINQTRGVLAEYGIVLARGAATLRRQLPRLCEDGEAALSGLMREQLAEQYERFCALDRDIAKLEARLRALAREHAASDVLLSVPGIGPLLATALPAHAGDGRAYRRARDFAASLGIVPRHEGTGGKTRLGPISKRGNGYLRRLLVHGARAVLARAHRHPEDGLACWALRVAERRGKNIAAVALANKLARIAWVVLRTGAPYQPRPA